MWYILFLLKSHFLCWSAFIFLFFTWASLLHLGLDFFTLGGVFLLWPELFPFRLDLCHFGRDFFTLNQNFHFARDFFNSQMTFHFRVGLFDFEVDFVHFWSSFVPSAMSNFLIDNIKLVLRTVSDFLLYKILFERFVLVNKTLLNKIYIIRYNSKRHI